MGNILVLILEVEDHQFPHHFVHKHTEINHTCKPTKSNYQLGIFMVQIKSRSTNELFVHVSPLKRKDNRLKRRIRKVIEIQCSPTLNRDWGFEFPVLAFFMWLQSSKTMWHFSLFTWERQVLWQLQKFFSGDFGSTISNSILVWFQQNWEATV